MKSNLKNEARRLRKQEGLSLGDIAKKLNVSKSSVSNWVRGIQLSDEQESILSAKDPARNRSGSKGRKSPLAEKYLKQRQIYQAEGRKKALENDSLHMQGCLLYWAEGSKGRNVVSFSNSDVTMMKVFIKFLRECYFVTDAQLTIYIHCYVNNDLSQKEIETFWVKELNIPISCLRKTTVGKVSSDRGNRANKLPYGVCNITVCRTDIVQNIYGAIQQYSGYDNPEWIL